MASSIFVFISLAAAVTAGCLYWRRSVDQGPAKLASELSESAEPVPVRVARNVPLGRKRNYYGVSVHPGINACEAVEKLRWKRFLTTEAPKLPLPGCKRPACRCFLQPENDRRSGFDCREDSFSAYGDYRPHAYKQRRTKKGPDRRQS